MKNKIIIYNQKQLIKYFNDDTLRIEKKSKLIFNGNLKLGSNISFSGKVEFGKHNKVESNCRLRNSSFGNNIKIRMSSIVDQSKVDDDVIIGPFAFIRQLSHIGSKCIIGAYVEVTRSTINKKSYASHRTFIGDAKIGENVIIGAGVVFCNYNFKSLKKEKITVGKNCKIGSNSVIIAPKKIKANTLIPALSKK